MFTPNLGEDEAILTNIFQMGWFNHQLVIKNGKDKLHGSHPPWNDKAASGPLKTDPWMEDKPFSGIKRPSFRGKVAVRLECI